MTIVDYGVSFDQYITVVHRMLEFLFCFVFTYYNLKHNSIQKHNYLNVPRTAIFDKHDSRLKIIPSNDGQTITWTNDGPFHWHIHRQVIYENVTQNLMKKGHYSNVALALLCPSYHWPLDWFNSLFRLKQTKHQNAALFAFCLRNHSPLTNGQWFISMAWR